jgi:hypothetical protein
MNNVVFGSKQVQRCSAHHQGERHRLNIMSGSARHLLML